MKSILDYETVDYDRDLNIVKIIDQTKLPSDIQIEELTTSQQVWDAIYLLKVRGAPAIGVAAAFGLAMLACQIETTDLDEFERELISKKDFINSSRPTAVNLSWALGRIMDRYREVKNRLIKEENIDISIIKNTLLDEAYKIKEEDILVCRSIGEYGLSLLKPGDGILTHCNAGQLATCKYGTATAPIYLGHEKGYGFHVFADETRPLLQGARLTAFELSSAGVDVTLICDNMAASVMAKGKVNAVLVGCDRVAANGDTANKIGTLMTAVLAKHYNIPFYVCAPTSTIDMTAETGADIVIEQRDVKEVSHMWYKEPMTAENVKIYNPAFDVTDGSLITGFITEKGIFKSPKEM